MGNIILFILMRLHLKNKFPYKFKTKNYWLINEEMIQLFPVVLKGNWHISTVKFSFPVVSNSLWPPWTVALQASLSITTQSSLKLMSIEAVLPSNHLILYHPLFFLPSIFPSTKVLSNESVLLIRWPKY